MRIAIDILADVPGSSGQVNIHRNVLYYLPRLRPEWNFYVFSTPKLTNHYKDYLKEDYPNLIWVNCWYDNYGGSLRRIITQELQIPFLIAMNKIDVFLCYPMPFLVQFQKKVKTINRHTFALQLKSGITSFYRQYKHKFSIKKSDCTIFNSQAEYNYAKSIGINPPQYKVIWESFDSKIFQLGRTQGNSSFMRAINDLIDLKKKIIYVPTGLARHKNSQIVLEAINACFGLIKDNYVVIFTGNSEKQYKDYLMEKYRILFENNFVDVFGHCSHEEIAFIGKNSHVIIYPSLIETFGIPPLEMMALEKPVIISDSEALVEISGAGCLVFNRNSFKDLEEKLLLLLNSVSERTLLSEKGKNYVKRFSWERNSQETIRLIEDIMEQ